MVPIDSDIATWREQLAGQNFSALRLKYAGNATAMHAILQLECRKKAASKLPSILKNDKFCFPTLLSAEQCTSEPLANFHSSLIHPEDKILDMTCGLGIDSFHLASVCQDVLAIDIDQNIVDTANYNARILNIKNFKAICADSATFIETLEDNSFSSIFIDPARRNNGRKVVFLNDCSPNVSLLLPRMLSVAPRVIIKTSPMLDATAAAKELSNVKEIYTIGTATECKELMLVCERGYYSTPELHAVTLTKDNVDHVVFSDLSTYAHTYVSELEPGQFLYEPYPAVMKSGRFNDIASKYDVHMLSCDTHIFTSNIYSDNFPGKQMRILYAAPYNKRTIKYIKNEYSKVNVTTRGFIQSALDLAKSIDIAQGGNLMLYGVGLSGKRNYWLAVCEII